MTHATPPELGLIRAQIAAGPMLIEESFLDAVCATLDRGGQLGPGPADADTAMSVFSGRYDPRSRFSVTDDGIAIVGVRGMLVNRGGWLGSIWGMTSYEGLAEQLRRCAADDEVRHIVLDIDSGGGMAAGLWDLLPAIAKARDEKPVTAIANAWACSAAYAIGAAAGQLYASRASTTGSIGVVRQHFDMSGALAKGGYRVTMFKAGAYKTAGSSVEELTPEVRAYIQAGIDEAYDEFVDHVSASRRLDPDAVRATEARVYGPADAVDLGLADGILTFEELLDHIRTPRPVRHSSRKKPMTRSPGQTAAGAENASTDLASVISATISAMRAEAIAQPAAQQTAADDRMTRAEAEAMATEAATRAVTADRARTAAVLSLPEATGHERRALQLAHETQMSAEQIKAFLADLPKAAAAAPSMANALATAMKTPGTSAGVRPDATTTADGSPSARLSLADKAKARFATGTKRS